MVEHIGGVLGPPDPAWTTWSNYERINDVINDGREGQRGEEWLEINFIEG